MDAPQGSGPEPGRPQPNGAGRGGAGVVALGEALIRFSAPGWDRLEQVGRLEVSVGGSELNMLIALSQLGYLTTFVSRLPANPLGRLIARHARGYGVGLQVEWDEQGRAGAYFIEHGAPPRATEVLYDRAGSAASMLGPDQFDWDALAVASAAVHVTGITCALGPGPRAAARALLQAARNHRVPASFDLNHRSRLWSDEAAVAAFGDMLPLADVVFASPHDLVLVLGRDGTPAELAAMLASRFGTSALVVRETARPAPGEVEVAVRVAGDQTVMSPAYRAEVVDPFGAGDVAAAAFLASWLADRDAAAAADRAARAYAHMNTVPGDAWAGSPRELAPDYARGRTVLR